ncbi:MAG: sugar ABC transporter substrate-binding protein [Betaproteobacteria bacterium]|nr:sugar ABC transporter substrate-binding protein [Betaproteobacteria bacterium]
MPSAFLVRNLKLLAVTGFLACVGGCNNSASDITTVKFWAMGREGEVVSELLPEFERTHPGIKVVVQQLPWTAAHEKLLTAFAGNAMPDIFQLGNTWIPEFVALNALESLEAFAHSSTTIDSKDYFEGIWDTNVVGGQLYGVPWYVDTRLLFYNRDLLKQAGFAAPPKTWDEWSRMNAGLKALVGSDRFSVLLPLNEFEPLLALALQHDEPLLRDGGRWGNFRSASFRRTLAYYRDTFKNKWAPPMTNSEISNVWAEFGRGYFSFYISGPWNIGEFKRRLPADQQSIWMTASLPGPDGPGASIAGGASLVVFRSSKHKAQAMQLIEYLSTPAVQERFHALTGNLPPRRATWRYESLDRDIYAKAFREQLERARATPKVPEWERIATEMRLVTERVIHGDIDIDQAVYELDARTDRILEKRRWMLDRGTIK